MKRHAALEDLSRDHYDALIHAKRLEESGDDGEAARFAAERFLNFWLTEAKHHFREEEEVLLPVVARYGPPTEDADVRRMLDDHAWFRDRAPVLAARLDAGADVTDLAVEVGARLREHVRLEERLLFQRWQEKLTEEDLEDIRGRSLAFRLKWRGERAVGPRTGDECAV